MTDPILWRLVWKEYRTQRAFWLAVAALAVLCQIGWLALRWYTTTVASDLFSAALVFAALYALGCTATLFAAEREDGTLERLWALAAPPGRLLLGKLGFAALSTACITGFLWAAAWILAPRPAPEPNITVQRFVWSFWGVAILEVFAWGILFSALVKRPLHAACLAGAAATCLALVQLSSDEPVHTREGQRQHWIEAAPMRLSVACPVLIVAAALAWRRARGRNVTDRTWWFRMLPERDSAWGGEVASAYAVPRGPLGSLIWHERRQATRTILLFVAATAAVVLLAAPDRSGLWAYVLLAVGALMGSCTFLAEQERRRFRFLAHHGVSARRVWLSKHLIWMPAVTLAPVGVLLLALLAESIVAQPESAVTAWRSVESRLGSPHNLLHLSLSLLLAYSAGQFASMLIPRGVVAGFVALVLTGSLVGWQMTMLWLGVSVVWSVAPLAAVLMAGTWLRAPDWLLERPGWRAWSRLVASVALPVVALLVAVATYRVYEIPGGGPGFATHQFLSTVTPAHRETAALYRRALAELAPLPEINPEHRRPIAELTRWQDTTPEMRRWLKANGAALKTALAASRRPLCLFYDPAWTTDRADLEKMKILARLVLLDGVRLESEDRLDDALDRYLAVLRMASHTAYHAGFYQRAVADAIEAEALDRLVPWTAHEDQTSARIVAAFRQYNTINATRPDAADRLKSEYLSVRRLLLSDDPAQVAGAVRTAEEASTDIVIGRLMPWERQRTLRLLDAWCQHHLAGLAIPESGSTEANFAAAFPRHSVDELEKLTQTTPYATDLLNSLKYHPSSGFLLYETRRGAAQIILALKAWQLDHGALPASLDALVGTYLDKLPPDPYSGKNFNYHPAGFPTAVDFGMPRDPVSPGRPLLWSTYPGNAILKRTGVSPTTGLPFYVVVSPNRVGGRWGWAFPIPWESQGPDRERDQRAIPRSDRR